MEQGFRWIFGKIIWSVWVKRKGSVTYETNFRVRNWKLRWFIKIKIVLKYLGN